MLYNKRKKKVILYPMAKKPIYKILLSDDDKKLLNSMIQNKNSCKNTIQRCQILLKLDESVSCLLKKINFGLT